MNTIHSQSTDGDQSDESRWTVAVVGMNGVVIITSSFLRRWCTHPSGYNSSTRLCKNYNYKIFENDWNLDALLPYRKNSILKENCSVLIIMNYWRSIAVFHFVCGGGESKYRCESQSGAYQGISKRSIITGRQSRNGGSTKGELIVIPRKTLLRGPLPSKRIAIKSRALLHFFLSTDLRETHHEKI